ncbi:MAG: alanine:cation symporter family protein [Saprospiraceae bacterium]|nr:alanine:cation symporter family protein [Saprospiraceae bacterium]MCB9319800.1 alanine:cation symporter family protein [Lewinellaceae bacterium]
MEFLFFSNSIDTTLVQSLPKQGLDDLINTAFDPVASAWESLVLSGFTGPGGISIPIVLCLLVGGATFFTLIFGFVNIRLFPLSLKVVRGHYDTIEHADDPIIAEGIRKIDGDIVDTIKVEGHTGELSHFQALSAAVSGTVGLGNIAGVAVAIVLGGPGATFWMIIAGLLGMTSKFVECTLGVKYRDIDQQGVVYGGPMYYLSRGLQSLGWSNFGKGLAILFSILCVGASFGGGNAFQANQAAKQIISQFGIHSSFAGSLLGAVMAVFVALVIIGGVKRIGRVTEKLVPFMAIIYVGAGLIILIANYHQILPSFSLILQSAFKPVAIQGGIIGVLITGFRRAAFSNEAGVGSAAIAHSAVSTRFPASEGIVALLEPFIDTVVICTMTALVIIVTGNYINPDNLNGVDLTTRAFEHTIPGFSYVLTLAILLFAFSTMISWSYYGLQSWKYLFGRSRTSDITYKLLFLLFVVIGAAATLDAVIKFSDAMILALVFPNMIGLLLLFPRVREELRRYLKAIRNAP